MQRLRRVAILIETSRAYGRGLLRGIADYNLRQGRWLTYFQPQGLGDPPPPWLKSWRGDGILARIDTQALADAVTQKRVPVVNLRGTLGKLNLPFIGSDNKAVAQLGAEHLLQRGFRNFAFVGFRRLFHPGFDQRSDCFQAEIAKAGFSCEAFPAPAPSGRSASWELEQSRLARWLERLPKPLGIMTANDDRGFQVLDACRRAGCTVPDEVAVIGVDNDELLCELSIPPLTSIDINSAETGFRAASLLDRLMDGKKLPKQLPMTRPRGVVVRRSTDVLALKDEEVVKAIMFIRNHACQSITVRDVLQHVAVSRSSLEPRFKNAVGATIHHEIVRTQIERAKELLGTTTMPIKQVAQVAGFHTPQYLTRVFKSASGETPAAYRRMSVRLSRENQPENPAN